MAGHRNGEKKVTNYGVKRGRVTIFTEELGERILKGIRGGNFMETSAAMAGVHPETVRKWLKRGKEGEAPYAGWAEEAMVALAKDEAGLVGAMYQHSRRDFRATQGLLIAKYKVRWEGLRQTNVQVTGAGGGPVEIDAATSAVRVLGKLARFAARERAAELSEGVRGGGGSGDGEK